MKNPSDAETSWGVTKLEKVVRLDQSRVCTKCLQTKSLSEFHKAAREKFGVIAQCKACRKIDAHNRHVKNREADNERNRQYAIANVEKNNLRSKEWAKNNPDRVKKAQAAYRLRHKEALIARRKANLHYSRNVWNKRKAQKHANGIFQISKKELKRLYNKPCTYCGSTSNIEMDHVIPIKLGGRHSIGNLVPACRTCNRSKSGKLLVVWKKLNDIKTI